MTTYTCELCKKNPAECFSEFVIDNKNQLIIECGECAEAHVLSFRIQDELINPHSGDSYHMFDHLLDKNPSFDPVQFREMLARYGDRKLLHSFDLHVAKHQS